MIVVMIEMIDMVVRCQAEECGDWSMSFQWSSQGLSTQIFCGDHGW